jgi:hypothetical protein
MRPNRVQPAVCRAIIVEALGPVIAEAIIIESGVAALPAQLPSGPRDLGQLQAELAPFVALYRALLERVDRESALVLIRRAIIESGFIAHHDDVTQLQQPLPGPQPLTLTSPPPPEAHFSPKELTTGFALAMASFSCEGELLAYSHEMVRFKVTNCNWCRALERLGAPELIAFVCETDERFMDGHPTHTLRRPTAIGLGHDCCDFQFMRR